eukprot:gene3990-4959_t
MMQKVKCPAPKCPDCQCPVAECARCPDCPEAQCPTCPECPFTRSCPECPVATCPPPKECPPEVNKADLDSAKLAEATARLDKVSESLAHSCDRDALLDKLLETERKYEARFSITLLLPSRCKELRRLYLREASATKRASFEVKGQLDEEDDRPQTYYISGDEESEPKMYCPPPGQRTPKSNFAVYDYPQFALRVF